LRAHAIIFIVSIIRFVPTLAVQLFQDLFEMEVKMPQFPVIGYQLQISTAPVVTPGTPTVDMIPRVFIQFQTGGQFRQLPINSAEEFMAICALIQAPGRLIFDNVQETLEKLMP